MKALSLTQPYATLIAIGAKRIETRSWRTSYRGLLAIHAAVGLGPVGGKRGLRDLAFGRSEFREALRAAGFNSLGLLSPERVLPLGAIVAVCDLVGCAPTARTDEGSEAYVVRAGKSHKDRELQPIWGRERVFGDFSLRRFAWLLANVRALPEPIPARGMPGLWDWTPPEGWSI